MGAPALLCHDVPDMVRSVRAASDAIVVLGGAAVGVLPAQLLAATGADWAVLGEGETVFPQLIEALANGEDPLGIPGVACLGDGGPRGASLQVARRGGPPPQAGVSTDSSVQAPVPQLDVLVPKLHRWLSQRRYTRRLCPFPIQAKRGCPHKCVYCTYSLAEGSNYRLCEPDAVADALLSLDRDGVRDAEFVDNVFNSPRDHAMAICERLARKNGRGKLRLHTMEMNPRFIDDELLAVMERAGFTSIGITADSASDPVLEGLGKGFDASHVYRAARAVERHGMSCLWMFLFGGPGETPGTATETLDFARANVRPSDVAFFNVGIRVYPGTEINAIGRRQGVVTASPEDMLQPVFYFSPEADSTLVLEQVRGAAAEHLNFLAPTVLDFPLVPTLHKMAHRLGARPPLWKHTRQVRRVLKLVGRDV